MPEAAEGLWSNLKTIELANLATATPEEVIGLAWHGIERVRGTPHLADAFLPRTSPTPIGSGRNMGR